MIVFLLKENKKTSFTEYHKEKIKIVIYIRIVKKGLEYVARELSVVLTK